MGQTKFVLATTEQYAEAQRTLVQADIDAIQVELASVGHVDLLDALTEYELNKKGMTIFRERATYTNAFDAEWGQTPAQAEAASEQFQAFLSDNGL